MDHRTIGSHPWDGRPLEAVRTVVSALAEEALCRKLTVSRLGVAVPGIVDEINGEVTVAPNLGWTDLALAELLVDQFRVPVGIMNDVFSSAMAEGQLGSAQRHDDFAVVAVGTGVGAAVVCNGKLVKGSQGGAGEIGHLVVRPLGERCGCGSRGCIEAYGSGSGLARRYGAASGRRATSAEIVSLLPSDPIAQLVWDEGVEALAFGMAAICATVQPSVVVLGGGLSLAGDKLLVPLRNSLAARLALPPPPILVSHLGTRSVCVGASLVSPTHGTEFAAKPDRREN